MPVSSWSYQGLKTRIEEFSRDDSGATAIEYSLIVAGIFLAIASTIVALGPLVFDLYDPVVGAPQLQ